MVTPALKAIIERRLHALYRFVARSKCNVGRRSNQSVTAAQKHVFAQHASQQPLSRSNPIANGDILRLK